MCFGETGSARRRRGTRGGDAPPRAASPSGRVPTLTAIAPDKEQIAARCLDVLAARMLDPAGPGREVVTSDELAVRQSTGGR